MSVRFALPYVLLAGLPLAALLAVQAVRLARAGLPRRRAWSLLALRALALAAIVLLLARPERDRREDPADRRRVALLVDRSRSMALTENGTTRIGRALRLAREGILPALQRRGLTGEVLLFDDVAVPAPLPADGAVAAGERTNLGGAIQQAASGREPPPLAVLALTDGAANRSDSNSSALLALLEARVPFAAVGLGRDAGIPTLGITRLLAPAQVPPRQSFRVSALLQSTGEAPLPSFELVLLRDGRLRDTRRVAGGTAARFWSEGFEVTEDEEGVHEYTVQLRPPDLADLVCVSRSARAPVRIGREKEFRVLFVQGALTWDFKFIGRALRGDGSVRVTGLSRTSAHSVFRQNVESAGELLDGFPKELVQLAPFRVVVLSELKPADLQPEQQELLARFCAELGGGVLLLGGASTFDGSWQGSRLEQLLPVTFDTAGGVSGLDRPFHLRLTDEARRHPVFQLGEGEGAARAWDALPTFSQYGRVLAEKPGAVVWARHAEDTGPHGRRILMAAQSYGSGTAAIICVQNLWRWRLARQADPQSFDRFWQQLFRHLGQSGRQDVLVQVLDQELRPQSDVRVLLLKQPRPEGLPAGPETREYSVRVTGPGGKNVREQKMPLLPSRPVGMTFRAEAEGTYTVTIADAGGATVATQPLEVREVDRELARTGRDLPNLRQWAAASGGLAVPEEECTDAEALVDRVVAQARERAQRRTLRQPVGWGAAVLAGVVALLCAEWALRRRFGLA